MTKQVEARLGSSDGKFQSTVAQNFLPVTPHYKHMGGSGAGGGVFPLTKSKSRNVFPNELWGVWWTDEKTISENRNIRIRRFRCALFYSTNLHKNTPHTPTTTLCCVYSLIIRDMQVLVHICLLDCNKGYCFPQMPINHEVWVCSCASHQSNFAEASTNAP